PQAPGRARAHRPHNHRHRPPLESLGENEIQSAVIGELIMQALQSLDKVAYVRFASVYKNFRETKDFEILLGELEGDDDKGRKD
ncbi:MAG: hypothetical protein JO167_09640, partial [Alphaproteobacteria bacterium]|nr:hypothetical protein [Alphaproteobacteria bacterium]